MSTAPNLDVYPLDYGSATWLDPITGFTIPKTLQANCDARDSLASLCRQPGPFRDATLEHCRTSILFWINLFVFTYNIHTVDDTGRVRPAESPHVPFITWPVQDAAILALVDAINHSQDAIIDKSRDMGASWITVTVAVWYWLFDKDKLSLLTSRVENLVDKPGDPDTLFWKVDYILQRLPEWMLPVPLARLSRGGDCRSHMHLRNPVNGCCIDGQATTEHIGRGARRFFVLLDEMAAMSTAAQAWQCASDTGACRIGSSTPLGPGTAFTHLRHQGIVTGKPRVIPLMYYNHPQKGRGREQRTDTDGSITGTAGRVYWSSPWFVDQCQRRQSTEDIGQNILADHATSGGLFFNAQVITSHMQSHATLARRHRLERVPNHEAGGIVQYRMVDDPQGNWYVWGGSRSVPPGTISRTGRPIQGLMPGAMQETWQPSRITNYVIFCDIATGNGASNSVAAVLDCTTGHFIAEFVDCRITPEKLAEEVCRAGQYLFGGQHGFALLGWECNGPGESFYRDVLEFHYPQLYHRRTLGQEGEPRTKSYGWRSTRTDKQILLRGLSKAITRGDITVYSKAGLNEMLEYIHYDDGSIGPGKLRDDQSGARESHGDRVIAYAGAIMLRAEAPKYHADKPRAYPPGTLGHLAGHNEIFNLH